jgi:hypothetical protein
MAIGNDVSIKNLNLPANYGVNDTANGFNAAVLSAKNNNPYTGSIKSLKDNISYMQGLKAELQKDLQKQPWYVQASTQSQIQMLDTLIAADKQKISYYEAVGNNYAENKNDMINKANQNSRFG